MALFTGLQLKSVIWSDDDWVMGDVTIGVRRVTFPLVSCPVKKKEA
jgi:hypothetical protein